MGGSDIASVLKTAPCLEGRQNFLRNKGHRQNESISLGGDGQGFGLPDGGRNSPDFERKREVPETNIHGARASCQTLSWMFCIWGLIQSSGQGCEVR